MDIRYINLIKSCVLEVHDEHHHDNSPETYYYDICWALCYSYKHGHFEVFKWLLHFMNNDDYFCICDEVYNNISIKQMIDAAIDFDFWDDHVLSREDVPLLVEINNRRNIPTEVWEIVNHMG